MTAFEVAATLLGPTGRFYKVYRQRAAPAAPGPGNGGKCVSHSRPGPQDVHASHEAPLSPRTPDPADLECHTQNRSTADGGAIPSSTQRSPGGDTRTKVPGWRGRTPPGGGRQPTATPGRDPASATRHATRPRHHVRSARRPPRASLISDSDSPFAYRYRHIPPTLLR